MKKLITLSLLLITLLTACNNPEETPEETPAEKPAQETPSIQPPEAPESNETPETESNLEPHPEEFDTINEYVDLITDSQNNTAYKTVEPKGMVMIRNVTPEGVDFVRYELWGLNNWESSPETDQMFFIKSYRSDPSTDRETITWFGPFKGKLSEKFFEKVQQNAGQES